jgi:hypothetical protein
MVSCPRPTVTPLMPEVAGFLPTAPLLLAVDAA